MLTDGDVANPDDPVGRHGDVIWALDTKMNREADQEDEEPLMDLTRLCTPTTPSDGFCD